MSALQPNKHETRWGRLRLTIDHCRRRLLASFVPLIFAAYASGSSPSIVTDIRMSPNPGGLDTDYVGEFIEMSPTLMLFACDGTDGVELWRSDGTPGGTALVMDIHPGRTGSWPHSFVGLGSQVYFFANDGTHGDELWATDGTAVNTHLVADIRTGPESSEGASVTVLAGLMVFFADDGFHGREPWISDGTPAGTTLLRDVRAGPLSSHPTFAALDDTVLYFLADDGSIGLELWRTDGTDLGTSLVKDIWPGPRDCTAVAFLVHDDLLYFAADDGMHGLEPWISDGTNAGTNMLKDIYPASDYPSFPYEFTSWGGDVYFVATSSTTSYQRLLWKTDGTEPGTMVVLPYALSAYIISPYSLFPTSDALYFVGWVRRQGEINNGWELCRTDGTAAGTQMVKDIYPGTSNSFPHEFTWYDGQLFFVASNSTVGEELWKTDGTELGTVVVKDIRTDRNVNRRGPNHLTSFGGGLFFTAETTSEGRELWISDGTEEGTTLIADLIAGSSNPRILPPMLNQLFFVAEMGASGLELWKSDGTPVGTTLVKNVRDELSHSDPRHLMPYDSSLLFLCDDGVVGTELWRSDGTTSGTIPVSTGLGDQSFNPPFQVGLTSLTDNLVFFGARGNTTTLDVWTSTGFPAGTYIATSLAAANKTLYAIESPLPVISGAAIFPLSGQNRDDDLWRTDGTLPGTFKLKEISSGDAASPIRELRRVGDTAYFTAQPVPTSQPSHDALWRSDGTELGTEVLADIWPNPDHRPTSLLNVDDQLFFIAGSDLAGLELWKSDGTPESTLIVKDIRPGPDGSDIDWLTPVGSHLYFTADAGDGAGVELWWSDGTDVGTRRVKDIRPGSVGSYPKSLTAVGNLLFFTANDGVHGDEPWRSDGTIPGTFMIKDIRPGPNSSSLPDNFVKLPYGKMVIFTAFTDAAGMELWYTDGTEPGTAQLPDIAPGPASSDPAELTISGDLLYCRANDDVTGRELWAMNYHDLDADGIPNVEDNCPAISNASQSDADNDAIGDACDICPARRAGDVDGDSHLGPEDLEPFVLVLLDPLSADPDAMCAADVNADGTVDGRDIAAFIMKRRSGARD
ncbi:MAG: thrombospondin type 3 repeat-containing protein [Planctomycetia bacterium]|nr:thrombospondin type 3 repeat-containing protein [Planctomycetia bacterium]